MLKFDNLILASSSEQRLSLLEQIGVIPGQVVSPDIDEVVLKKELPKVYSIRIAKEKGTKVRVLYPDKFILSADTVVCCGRRVLPKAETEEQALECIRLISGRRHRVYTTVCLYTPYNKLHCRNVMTIVKFKHLSMQEINSYIMSGQWKGKSGACSIQTSAGKFVLSINGSYSSVIGLPLYETYSILSQYFSI
ncbi:septum formation protein Maf [Ehrlichia chaffeensis str. Heartland]|uniref:Nucleoside triphosphate pyrophosphatase n=1 Tax=Ehrlichia chaffeensis (strain ATCC CRL-10679 / Arkansas) TaxID=205920 RepID=NTPP_EHRCR|nr:Maf family nucleotide pyrophosphatase [Ehrlichia chaffeensis]Q2GGV6.1 RecName: Full=Nucleoside triphosphate pyrophosphatase; AltName: Full=Nucleotide pyrophosphatase; Short=Nucleotide PPase [Ehrlichia chaffeensis str. Arkansas]ABD44795.1 maf protein [Ehrlichia chaffeensis str. Arkansas]AHX03607.1 septum formation protein Maf [Ehrlichia chaffeensis str. Heartland]AHX05671.1 septum formation protein Maf [Ehrlichia chaffeensis str. Jax]AHX06662.1 septum formation protein Maf [Ehrlichia chaffee